jgi:molybdate transport system ATP-binding protein
MTDIDIDVTCVRRTHRGRLRVEADFGRVVRVVGASGSGKTTALLAVAGLLAVEAGRVSVGGEVWFDTQQNIEVMARCRSVAMVFAGSVLFPHVSACRNVEMARISRAQATLLLDLCAVPARLYDSLSARLSTGEAQRVALARALGRLLALGSRPRLLLLDEPFSALDAATRNVVRREVFTYVQSLSQVVTLLVSHDDADARAWNATDVQVEAGNGVRDGAVSGVL